jgi:polysaccharide pyruvyl transferase CsaB
MEGVSNRILIAGCIGFGNTGDEAIAKVVTDHLRELIPGVEITIVSGNPARTAETYGVGAVAWQDPRAIIEAVRNTDLTILGGGGLFQDYEGFDPDAVLTREHWGLSFYITPALLSAIYSKPFMLYAVGVGPLLSEHGRKYTKAAADIASRITVRDPVSKELFESLGVSPDKVTVTADPAFDLAPAADSCDLPEVREWTSSRPAIAVCLRKWNVGSLQAFCERQIRTALDDFLESEGGRLLFIPFHQDPDFTDDLAVANSMLRQLRHRQNAAVLTRPCSPATLAGIIANADLVLGMRLHSVIFSLSASVPFVALEYDPKIAAMTALAGFEEFTIPLGAIESDVLVERMQRALHGRERFRELAGKRAHDLRSGAKENAVIAAELLRVAQAVPPASLDSGSASRQSGITDYGPDARALIARLVTSQAAATESLIERLRVCGEALALPVAEMGPFAIADALVRKGKDLQTRIRELEETHTQLAADSGQEADRLRRELEDALLAADQAQKRFAEGNLRIARELQDARREMDTAQESFAMERRRTTQLSVDLQLANAARQQGDERVAELTNSVADLERQVARHESKTFGGIVKRALQAALDMVQILTPSPLRAVVRKYYLNWFYFRIYPERRTGTPQSRIN